MVTMVTMVMVWKRQARFSPVVGNSDGVHSRLAGPKCFDCERDAVGGLNAAPRPAEPFSASTRARDPRTDGGRALATWSIMLCR